LLLSLGVDIEALYLSIVKNEIELIWQFIEYKTSELYTLVLLFYFSIFYFINCDIIWST
jgi:hypothetical protein